MRAFTNRSSRSSQATVIGLLTLALVINGPMATGMSMTDIPAPEVTAAEAAEPTPEVTAAEAGPAETDTAEPDATGADVTEPPAEPAAAGSTEADPLESTAADGDQAPMVDPVEDTDESGTDEGAGALPDEDAIAGASNVSPADVPAADEAPLPEPVEDVVKGPDSGDPSVPVEEYVPGIQVIPGDGSATIYWPDFGTEDVYVVQFEQADGTWKTVETDVDPVDTTDLEGPTIVDNSATIDDLKNGKQYTARIVAADSLAEAKEATDDALDVDGGRGSSAMGRVQAADGDASALAATQTLDFTINGYIQSKGNPNIPDSCGLDLTLVLDASGSIQTSSAISTVRDAASAFLDSLKNTNSSARVTQFGTGTQQLAPSTTIDDAALEPGGALDSALAGYYNPRPPVSQSTTWQYDGSGAWTNVSNWDPSSTNQNSRNQYTNWDGALDQANDTTPRLIVFITDGDPTAVNLDQAEDPRTGLGYNTFRGDGTLRTVNRAIEEANLAKTQGTRILTIGVGNGLSSTASQERLKSVSGPQLVTDAQLGSITSINQIDVAVVTDFNKLAQALRSIVLELCSPSLTVRKFAQTTAGDYAPAPGWDITVKPEVPSSTAVPPFTWILPDTAAAPAKTVPTNAEGFSQFQWEPNPKESDSRATVTEALKTGFSAGRPGTDNDYICELKDESGNTRSVVGDFDQIAEFGIDPIGQEIVTCSLYNSRKTANMTLQKEWVGVSAPASATLNVDGSTDGSATSNAPAAPGTTNSVTVRVLAGETVTLSEQLSGGADLSTTLECTDSNGLAYREGELTGSYAVPLDPVDVTCTFRNSARTNVLTLRKAWAVNSVVGDQAVLTIAGGVTSPVSATSTAPDAVTVNNATVQVRSGASVTVSEVVSGTGSYTPVLECTGGVTPNAQGQFTMPNTPVVCTYTNTRTQNLLTLRKAWVNGFKDDSADLRITGGLTDPADATSTANGDTGSWTDPSTAATDVSSGEQVTVSEVLGSSNTGSYTPTWECVAGDSTVASGSGAGGSFTMPNEPVVCTITNTRDTAQVRLQKAWVNARGGDSAALTIKGGLPEAGTPTTTSTATGALGTIVDVTKVASSTVQVGDTVTVTEVLGASNVGKYTSTLVCDNGVVPAADGSFAMPNASVTCTFTNDRSVTAPAPPAPTAETCDPNVPGAQLLGSITVPANPDYSYSIDGKAFAAGTYPFAAGSYTVTAQLIVTAPLAAAGFGGLQQLAAQGVYTWTVVVAGSPVCAVLDKESDPATGPVFTDQVVTYRITVKNGGDTAVVGETLVDKLPVGVEVIESSISPSGVYDATARTITWRLDLPAAAASVPSSVTFTYQVTVTADAGTITNSVTWVERSLTDSTTLPVEPGEVGGEETTDEPDEVVGGSEDLAETGAGSASNVAAAGLLAMLLGGLMVGFGSRRRREE